MISDFEHLAQKVEELAALTHALRRENAELRAQGAVLGAENAELAARMQAAHARVAALLDQLPLPQAEQDDIANAADAADHDAGPGHHPELA